MKVLGIDLGTTFSSIAFCHTRVHTDIYADSSNATDIASVVHYKDGKFTVGSATEVLSIREPKQTIFDTKRMIGRRVEDPGIQEMLSCWPFTVEDNGQGMAVISVPGCPKIEPYKVSGEILKHLVKIADDRLPEPIRDCVITVPANFTNAQKEDTLEAAKYAGLNVLELVPEPTAAAISFGILSGEESKDRDETIVVVDFGGGTLDISVLRVKNEQFEVKAVAGDTMLGGRNIDECLLEYILKREKFEHIRNNSRAIARMKRAIISAKIQLSTENRAVVYLDGADGDRDLDCWLDRQQFVEVCQPVLKRITRPIESALEMAGITKDQVDRILLVGGSSHLPSVKEIIGDYFGKRPYHGVDASKAVVQGAAIVAAKLRNLPGLAGLSITNVCPLSLGIASGGIMNFVIRRGTPFGSAKSTTCVTAHNYQTRIGFDVYEGERPQPKNNTFLGHFAVSDIPPRLAGEVSVTVTFNLDVNGILSVSAEVGDIARSTLTVNRDKSRYSRENIEAALYDAEIMSEQDARGAALDKEYFNLLTLHENVIRYLDHERGNISKVLSSATINALRITARQNLKTLNRDNVSIGQLDRDRQYYQDSLRPVFFSGANAPNKFPLFLT